MNCEAARDLAAEIALGIADGRERAEALRHLSTCAECRHEVEQLSQVADELLMLAPVEEPPAGFESNVVGRAREQRPPRRAPARRLSPRWLAPRLAPALAAVAVTAAALIAVYHDDRQTADRYRETLSRRTASTSRPNRWPMRLEPGAGWPSVTRARRHGCS